MRRTAILKPAALMPVLATLLLATPTFAEDKLMDRLITVSATGYSSAEPDRARVSSGVTAEAATAREALTANTKAMDAVIAGLKESGVDAKDIQTSTFNVEPRYTHPRDGSPASIDGYRVSNQVDVVVRDLSTLGGLLDKLITLGANQMNGLTFEVSEAETLRDAARKEAVANARRRAELLAEAAGAALGEVMTINEEVRFDGPRPMAMRSAMVKEAAPIEAGSATLEASVTVTWRLK